MTAFTNAARAASPSSAGKVPVSGSRCRSSSKPKYSVRWVLNSDADARRLARLLCRVLYERVEVAGEAHIPRQGAVMLCANHTNAIADAIIILATYPGLARPLARSGLFRMSGKAECMRLPCPAARMTMVVFKRLSCSESRDHTVCTLLIYVKNA